jgi:hypothetical protein
VLSVGLVAPAPDRQQSDSTNKHTSRWSSLADGQTQKVSIVVREGSRVSMRFRSQRRVRSERYRRGSGSFRSTLRIACFSLLSSGSDVESTRYIYLDASSVTGLRQHYGGGVGRVDGGLGQNTPAVMRG